MTSSFVQRVIGQRLGFAHGEKFVAATGMAFVSTLILSLVAMSWYTTRSVNHANSELTRANASRMASVLAAQAELRLQEQDLSGLRRLMLDAGASGGVEHCAVSVPGGGVVASTVTPEITVESMDQVQGVPSGSGESSILSLGEGRVRVSEPLQMSDGRVLLLEMTTVPSIGHTLASTVQTASVVVGVGGLLVTLVIYRRFRSKLAAVGESLLAFFGGERRVPCLLVGESLGSEAQAWNMILGDRAEAENATVDAEIRETMLAQKDEGVGFAEACNALTQGVVILDHTLHVLYANGAGCSFLGVERDRFAGQSFDGEVGAELVDAVRQVLDGAGGSRRVLELGDLSQLHEGGTIMKISIAQVSECEDRRVILMIQDITQQRLSDESRNSLMAQATHELRTPLTNIRLYVEEAIEAGPEDEAIRDRAFNVINKEARRLERIIADMMSVSEIEAGSLSIRVGDMRVDQMVEDLVSDYQPLAKDKSIELNFDLPPKMPVLRADRDRVGQALHNLIGNALKYTPNGGKVNVSFEFDEHDAMRVDVTDTGIGIDPDECAKIFEKFYRADDRRISDVTGSGLGLALAREIARLHGGDITVESVLDQGSTFTFVIPGHAGQMSKAA